MILARMELTVYADDQGLIDPDRVKGMIDQADTLGYVNAPIEYVEPIGGDPRAWGLRIVGIDEDDREVSQ